MIALRPCQRKLLEELLARCAKSGLAVRLGMDVEIIVPASPATLDSMVARALEAEPYLDPVALRADLQERAYELRGAAAREYDVNETEDFSSPERGDL